MPLDEEKLEESEDVNENDFDDEAESEDGKVEKSSPEYKMIKKRNKFFSKKSENFGLLEINKFYVFDFFNASTGYFCKSSALGVFCFNDRKTATEFMNKNSGKLYQCSLKSGEEIVNSNKAMWFQLARFKKDESILD